MTTELVETTVELLIVATVVVLFKSKAAAAFAAAFSAFLALHLRMRL